MKIEDIKKRKIELGYTNEMIAEKSGVPLGTVQKFFGGATSKPRFNTIQSIECVLFPELHGRKEAAIYKEIAEKTRCSNELQVIQAIEKIKEIIKKDSVLLANVGGIVERAKAFAEMYPEEK